MRKSKNYLSNNNKKLSKFGKFIFFLNKKRKTETQIMDFSIILCAEK